MERKITKLIGISFIFLALSILLFTYTKKEVLKIQSTEQIKLKEKNKEYFAIIEIPKIHLKQEIFDATSKENDVDKNVYLHPASSIPNHIILAAHSGYGPHAYFKNLYKLHINDIVKVYNQDYVYEFDIQEIEYQDKTGILYLKNNQTLILITCTKNDDSKQTIYYGKLKNVQKI